MKQLNIKDILLTKSAQQQLAHFYIVRAPQTIEQQDDYLKQWMDSFLVGFISQQKGVDLHKAEQILQFDVADVLQIRKSEDHKRYVVDDLRPLFQFVELRPFEFKTKVAVVHQAHLLDQTASNKLLKLLEEPTDNTIIFFLFGAHGHAIKTIESRGINIQLSDSDQKTQQIPSMTDFLQREPPNAHRKKLTAFLQQQLSLADLLDYVQKKREAEDEIIAEITSLYRYYAKNYLQTERSRIELEKYEKHKTLNMPIKTRLFPLIHLAKKDFTL